ncbi:DUF6734 family protein [Roseivirga sp. BDSF3-8]|uniref:DUF6734 family protein n=1 Tax=Roseivirga sp. BDSF3-8 TaxID=3241598 RepID=UPI003531D282
MSYKIIQSFWTKPFFQNKAESAEHRLKGGWPSEKYNYLSWAFSCLQLKKFYNQVELYTDDYGKYLLIDQLQLPYDKVSTRLNDLDEYGTDLWAIGKVYTYSLQKEPFIHVDGDVFLWEKLPHHLDNAPLVSQNIENEPRLYGDMMKSIIESFDDIPEELLAVDVSQQSIYAINAGVIGGFDIAFFQDYTKKIFAFIEKNKESISGINSGLFNCVYEQLLFYMMATLRDIDIACVYPGIKTIPEVIKTFRLAGHATNYVHTFGINKKDKFSYPFLEDYMKQLYPEYLERIENQLLTYEL